MNYTINGKPYTRLDIKKRCAELMAWDSEPSVKNVTFENNCFWVQSIGFTAFPVKNYCTSWNDASHIIEKCWCELMRLYPNSLSKWEYIIEKHNCTKLEAACICLIEINHSETT